MAFGCAQTNSWVNSIFIFAAFATFCFLSHGDLWPLVLTEPCLISTKEWTKDRKSLYSWNILENNPNAVAYYPNVLLLFLVLFFNPFPLQRFLTHMSICSHFSCMSGLSLSCYVKTDEHCQLFPKLWIYRSRNLLISSCLICMICKSNSGVL